MLFQAWTKQLPQTLSNRYIFRFDKLFVDSYDTIVIEVLSEK